MKRIPPTVQMRQALTEQLQVGFTGHPLRQFVARVAEPMVQADLEAQVKAFFDGEHYAHGARGQPCWRNGNCTHALRTGAVPLNLRPPKMQGTVTPFRVSLLVQSTSILRALARRAYVRGLSVRDVEGLYAKVFGGALLEERRQSRDRHAPCRVRHLAEPRAE
jgi:hypothetical protein